MFVNKTADRENDVMPRPLVRAKKAAPVFGVTERCFTNWFHRGLVPGYQVGKTILFDIEEVLAVIKNRNDPR